MQFFAKTLGIELWSKPGAVGFYFPIEENINTLLTQKAGLKKKLTTVTESGAECISSVKALDSRI